MTDQPTPRPSWMDVLASLSAAVEETEGAPPDASLAAGAAAPEPPPAPPPGETAEAETRKKRLDGRVRRLRAEALRDASFGLLADGYTHREIADARNVSVAVVRRDIEKAIRGRRVETAEGHAQLQIARLTKGLALVVDRVERGDLTAVDPLLKVVTALDRYHVAPRSRGAPERLVQAALAPPPLALTHAASPLKATEAAEPPRAEIDSDPQTDEP